MSVCVYSNESFILIGCSLESEAGTLYLIALLRRGVSVSILSCSIGLPEGLLNH